jgi:hypothetical protein
MGMENNIPKVSQIGERNLQYKRFLDGPEDQSGSLKEINEQPNQPTTDES